MSKRSGIHIVAGFVWIVLVSMGLGWLWGYSAIPGKSADPPTSWPVKSGVQRNPNGYTLVMFAHPHCPCTRASVEELSRIMAHANGRLAARVVFLQPAGFSDDWVQSDLWRSAGIIPGVTVQTDRDGAEAQRFGSATSGQIMLFDPEGRVTFSGGITPSRGHQGDNAGSRSVISAANGGSVEVALSAVFGCELLGPGVNCGATICR